MTRIRIGTRGSKLALWQSEWVSARLKECCPDVEITLEIIKTTGDQILDKPLAQIGDKGLFTKELERALLEDRVDLLVHSMKDVPTEAVDGIVTAAVPEREDPRDAFLGKDGLLLGDLPRGAHVATGSLRRRAQLLAWRPDLLLEDLRGNIDTRVRKLRDSGHLSGIILAAAGIHRIGLADNVTELLDLGRWLPAPGQGALSIQTRASDEVVREIAGRLDVPEVRVTVAAERAVLARLEGGCHVPMGAYARVDGANVVVDAFVAALSGAPFIRKQMTGPLDRAESIGTALGQALLDDGGANILRELS